MRNFSWAEHLQEPDNSSVRIHNVYRCSEFFQSGDIWGSTHLLLLPLSVQKQAEKEAGTLNLYIQEDSYFSPENV